MKHVSESRLWPGSGKKAARSDSLVRKCESPLGRLRRLTRAEIGRDAGAIVPGRGNLATLFSDLNQS